uniref:CHK kinase-like domain-containing protein n=1 Tax=Lutzomyia longipalpis TaxID=7200 RepID=A0A1B0CGR6_LUTLO
MASGKLVRKQDVVLVTRAECVEIVSQTLNLDRVHVIDYSIEAATLPTDKDQRELIERIGLFHKEVQLYSILLPKLKWNTGSSKWRPNCYLSRYDLLIMEELGHLGYGHVPDRMEFTEKHMQETLKCLARMHASSLEFEINHCENTRIDAIFGSLLFESQLTGKNTWFKAGLNVIEAFAKHKSTFKDHPSIRDDPNKLMEMMEKVYQLSESTREFQNVLCHRDLWSKNIMFQFPKLEGNPQELDYANPQHCLLMDFQICRYQPPAVDVLLTIFFNTRRQHRDEHMQLYLKFYYDFLKQELKKYDIDAAIKLPWEEFTRSCKHYALMPLIFNCIFVPLTHLAPGILTQIQKTDPERYHVICNTDRNEFVLQNMDLDDFYRDYVTEVMEELLQHLLT